jgi:hypothetical protein
MTLDDYHAAFIFVSSFNLDLARAFPSFRDLKELCGGIVGHVTVQGVSQVIGHGPGLDVIHDALGPWWSGPVAYHFEPGSARCIPFKPCKGRLGFFPCDYSQLSRLRSRCLAC